MFPEAFIFTLLCLWASYIVGPWPMIAGVLCVLGGQALVCHGQRQEEYEAACQRPLTRDSIEQKLTQDQWAVLEPRIRAMTSDGFISVKGVDFMMNITPANKKRLADLGYAITTDNRHARFNAGSLVSSVGTQTTTTTTTTSTADTKDD
jgi:hypothetical protein